MLSKHYRHLPDRVSNSALCVTRTYVVSQPVLNYLLFYILCISKEIDIFRCIVYRGTVVSPWQSLTYRIHTKSCDKNNHKTNVNTFLDILLTVHLSVS